MKRRSCIRPEYRMFSQLRRRGIVRIENGGHIVKHADAAAPTITKAIVWIGGFSTIKRPNPPRPRSRSLRNPMNWLSPSRCPSVDVAALALCAWQPVFIMRCSANGGPVLALRCL